MSHNVESDASLLGIPCKMTFGSIYFRVGLRFAKKHVTLLRPQEDAASEDQGATMDGAIELLNPIFLGVERYWYATARSSSMLKHPRGSQTSQECKEASLLEIEINSWWSVKRPSPYPQAEGVGAVLMSSVPGLVAEEDLRAESDKSCAWTLKRWLCSLVD